MPSRWDGRVVRRPARGAVRGPLQAGPHAARRRCHAVAELQANWPAVPIVFADTRPLAEEWTYRFLAAAARHAGDNAHALGRLADLPEPSAPPAPEPAAAERSPPTSTRCTPT